MHLKKQFGYPAKRGPLSAGFTLIELLVVVLIIGILSAVALPQYQKAVEKSRAAEALQMLRYMYQQKEAYRLENGTKYGNDDAPTNEDMGIELGNSFNCITSDKQDGEEYCCNKHWCYSNGGMAYGVACPSFWSNIVARRVNNGTPYGEEKFLYDLQYESCVGSPRIVCYNGNTDKDWCKMFKGHGNPI